MKTVTGKEPIYSEITSMIFSNKIYKFTMMGNIVVYYVNA